jgi:hypothetical protein
MKLYLGSGTDRPAIVAGDVQRYLEADKKRQ